MKKTVPLMCIFMITLLVLAGCSPSQDTAQSMESDVSEVQDAAFYSVCTDYSKAEVEQFANDVKDMILTSNWTALSKCIAYPITMGGVEYEDSASFLNAPFETALNPDAILAIQNETCTDMFCNYSGIMMGNGEVWISEVLNEDSTSAGLQVVGLQILK